MDERVVVIIPNAAWMHRWGVRPVSYIHSLNILDLQFQDLVKSEWFMTELLGKRLRKN
jgi:hypothetical protein